MVPKSSVSPKRSHRSRHHTESSTSVKSAYRRSHDTAMRPAARLRYIRNPRHRFAASRATSHANESRPRGTTRARKFDAFALLLITKHRAAYNIAMRRIHTPIAPAQSEPACLPLLLLLTCAPWARPQPDLYAAGTGESQPTGVTTARRRRDFWVYVRAL